jgi:hypothetical protein
VAGGTLPNERRHLEETTMAQRTSGAAIGWTMFAAIMMLILGAWWVIAGIAGIAKDDILVNGLKYTFKLDVTTWGWIHLLLGILVFLAGIALFRGAVWARSIGVVLAVLSALVGFAWLPYYPVWGVIFVVIAVFVIWSLTAHGRDIAQELD